MIITNAVHFARRKTADETLTERSRQHPWPTPILHI